MSIIFSAVAGKFLPLLMYQGITIPLLIVHEDFLKVEGKKLDILAVCAFRSESIFVFFL